MPAGRQGRNDVADYRPGLCSGLTPAPVTSNPSYHPAGRLAGVAALYATSVWRRWDQQCLSRFRSRSALRLVNAVRTCPGCHLGANTSAHAHTYTARDTHTHINVTRQAHFYFNQSFFFSLSVFIAVLSPPCHFSRSRYTTC